MKILTEGHKYELDNFEGPGHQEIQFIEKKASSTPGELVTINDGTTNEEILVMLLNRMQYLQDKFPCKENAMVITKLQESIMWLDYRTKDRIDRGVEGKHSA